LDPRQDPAFPDIVVLDQAPEKVFTL
jgi:hypothetical protein